MKYFRRSLIEDMYLKNGVYEAVGKAVPFVTVARQYVPKAKINELHGTHIVGLFEQVIENLKNRSR